MAERLGQQLGSYRLLRQLGLGGFAEVYLGEHVYLKTLAAIKVLHTRLEQADLERFLTEARTIASLVHPHIVRVLDFGVEEGTAFLVIDYAPHGSLREHYLTGVPLPPELILPHVQQVADALEYAHAANRIHCDIKPENLLLGRQEEVWLSDFGIAVLAQASGQQRPQNFVGTLAYAAPEQIQGQPVFASDQYALGVVVYEWLTGKIPFAGASRKIVTQQVMTPPQPLRERVPTISPAVEAAVLKALAKDPAARFASVADFAAAFTEASRSVTFFFSGWKPGLHALEGSDQESTLLPAELVANDFLPGQITPTEPTLPDLTNASHAPSESASTSLQPEARTSRDEPAQELLELLSADEATAEQALATMTRNSVKGIERIPARKPRVTISPAMIRRRPILATSLAALIVLMLLTALAYGAVGQGLMGQKGLTLRPSAGALALPTPAATGTPSPTPTQTQTVAFVVRPVIQVVYCQESENQASETITLDNTGSTVVVAWQINFVGPAWASASPTSGSVAAGAQATLILTLFDSICNQWSGNLYVASISYQTSSVLEQVLISTQTAGDDR